MLQIGPRFHELRAGMPSPLQFSHSETQEYSANLPKSTGAIDNANIDAAKSLRESLLSDSDDDDREEDEQEQLKSENIDQEAKSADYPPIYFKDLSVDRLQVTILGTGSAEPSKVFC